MEPLLKDRRVRLVIKEPQETRDRKVRQVLKVKKDLKVIHGLPLLEHQVALVLI